MTEISFIVEDALHGCYLARALSADIVTDADDLPAWHKPMRDAVWCHVGGDALPRLIRLHIVRRAVIAG
jgi:hypothetical protein